MENEVIKALKEIIRKHTVRYEVWPHFEISEGKRVMVGFDIELYGTHDRGSTRLSPGCPLCTETHMDLQRLTEWILPKDQRPSQYEIPPFDQSLHTSRGGQFEVVVPIRIEHRHSFFEPVDACEERCLNEMSEKPRSGECRAGAPRWSISIRVVMGDSVGDRCLICASCRKPLAALGHESGLVMPRKAGTL